MKLFKHIIILLFFTACTSNENKQVNIPIKNSHDSSKINVKTSPIKETSKPKEPKVDTLLTEPNYVDSIPYLGQGFNYWKDLYRVLGFSHLYDGKDSNCGWGEFGSLRKYDTLIEPVNIRNLSTNTIYDLLNYTCAKFNCNDSILYYKNILFDIEDKLELIKKYSSDDLDKTKTAVLRGYFEVHKYNVRGKKNITVYKYIGGEFGGGAIVINIDNKILKYYYNIYNSYDQYIMIYYDENIYINSDGYIQAIQLHKPDPEVFHEPSYIEILNKYID